MSPPMKSKVGEWKQKLSRSDRAIYEKYARTGLAMFKYELEKRPMTLAARAKEFYYRNVGRW